MLTKIVLLVVLRIIYGPGVFKQNVNGFCGACRCGACRISIIMD